MEAPDERGPQPGSRARAPITTVEKLVQQLGLATVQPSRAALGALARVRTCARRARIGQDARDRLVDAPVPRPRGRLAGTLQVDLSRDDGHGPLSLFR